MPGFTTRCLGREWMRRQTSGHLTTSASADHLLLTECYRGVHTFLQDDNLKLPKKKKKKSAFTLMCWVRSFLLIPPGGRGSSRGAGQAAESSSASNPCSGICGRLLCLEPWNVLRSLERFSERVRTYCQGAQKGLYWGCLYCEHLENKVFQFRGLWTDA